MRSLLLCVLAAPACLLAQNPTADSIKMEFSMARGVLTRSAEKASDSLYSYRPTDDVRTFGQIIGHVADAQYSFCSAVAGEKSPMTDSIEKTKTAKADLVQALKDAFAYCDKVYSGVNDTSGNQPLKFFGRDASKFGVLAFNNMHDYEHYGNLVTYFRLNHLVPPSSETAPPPAAAPKK